jgi:hypothetical protein
MTLPFNEQLASSRMQADKANRYYKVQVRAWTITDPAEFTLKEIAESIDAGAGVLTAVEVVKVVDDLDAVDDVEVRETFENIRAAERLLRNIKSLPSPLRERLQTALISDVRTSAAA